MIKKSVIWFLVLAFLNFQLVSDFVFADSGFANVGHMGGPSGGEVVAAVIVGVIVIGLIVFGVSKSLKKTDAQSEQPQDQKENPPRGRNFQQSDEQPLTPSGQFAVLSW
ncbi:MAG: hypothetical protein OEW04_06840 [Nitrospirota bacterium]|nr:hypothetical protein [Nitrospirota bacterium]